MALPDTFTNFLAAKHRAGPFEYGGSYYVVLLDSSDNSIVEVWKSDDAGTSAWSELDSGNQPNLAASVQSLKAVFSGTRLYIAAHIGSDVRYLQFNLSLETWALNESVTSVSTNSFDDCAIAVRDDGDVVIAYSGDSAKVMGTDYERLYYKVRTTSWGSENSLDDGGSVNYSKVEAILGASDKTHFTYSDSSNIQHKSLSSADSLSSAEQVNDTTSSYGRTSLAYLNDGTDDLVMVIWKKSSNSYLYSSLITNDGTPAAEVAVSSTTTFEGSTTYSPHAIAADDVNNKFYALWMNGTPTELRHAEWDTSWGSTVSTETGVNSNHAASAAVYDNDAGDTVLAYLHRNSSGNVETYNEYILIAGSSATNASTITASTPSSPTIHEATEPSSITAALPSAPTQQKRYAVTTITAELPSAPAISEITESGSISAALPSAPSSQKNSPVGEITASVPASVSTKETTATAFISAAVPAQAALASSTIIVNLGTISASIPAQPAAIETTETGTITAQASGQPSSSKIIAVAAINSVIPVAPSSHKSLETGTISVSIPSVPTIFETTDASSIASAQPAAPSISETTALDTIISNLPEQAAATKSYSASSISASLTDNVTSLEIIETGTISAAIPAQPTLLGDITVNTGTIVSTRPEAPIILETSTIGSISASIPEQALGQKLYSSSFIVAALPAEVTDKETTELSSISVSLPAAPTIQKLIDVGTITASIPSATSEADLVQDIRDATAKVIQQYRASAEPVEQQSATARIVQQYTSQAEIIEQYQAIATIIQQYQINIMEVLITMPDVYQSARLDIRVNFTEEDGTVSDPDTEVTFTIRHYTASTQTDYKYSTQDKQDNNQIVVTQEEAGQYLASVEVARYGDYHWAFTGEWSDGYKKTVVGEVQVERPRAFAPD